MKQLNNIERFYFIGIGGIGMSALARYFYASKKLVSGYDKTASTLTNKLQEEGILIQFEDDVSKIPSEYKTKSNTLIVYTPAIPKENKILNWFQNNNFSIVKRAELLGMITQETMCLAVAGTHGKTTTSAILGHLLAGCNEPVTAFLGGISENYNSNIIINGSEITVVEADEFDRSFLQLRPNIACVTSMDADHLDIYNDEAAIKKAFNDFAALLPEDGILIHKNGLPLNGKTVGINDDSDFAATDIRIEDGSYVFNLKTPKETIKNLKFHLPGHHNLLNAVTALGMAISLGSPTDCLSKALVNFKGVKRRFSYKIRNKNCVLIDDYAHHPSEINAVYQAVTELYPGKKVLVVFQPHLFSRTRDFANEFAKSLSQFEHVFLLDIYPAREKPIEGISSEWLLDKVNSKNKRLVSKINLGEAIKNTGCEIILLLGAGDIGEEVDTITKILSCEN